MELKDNGIITKSEIKFWMSLLAVVVGGVIAFTTLKMEVKAMADKGAKLRQEYENSIVEMKDDIKEIRAGQIKIMIEMGIEP